MSANAAVSNTVTVSTAGLETDNSAWSQEVDGIVTSAEVADLDVDGSPEVYVYVRSAGADEKGSVVAYVANDRKSLSMAFMAPLSDTPGAADGYRGQDEFAVLEGMLGRRFPIHDEAGAPTGKMRQLQYTLTPGDERAARTTVDGLWPAVVDRRLEARLVDVLRTGTTRPEDWRPLGPPFFLAGLAVTLASVPALDRRKYLDLAEALHPGAMEPRVFARWLAETPLPPSRLLPMLEAGFRGAA